MDEYCEASCEARRRRMRNEALHEEMSKPRPLNPARDNEGEEDEEEFEEDIEDDEEEDEEEDEEDEEDEEIVTLSMLHPQFFDLSAMDIDKNDVSFSDFRGKVTVITNVASECGYTESHYEGMVELYNEFSETGMFNIVAFPCNQFDDQEPGTNAEIKKFAQDAGAEFMLMDKIDVNGPGTHPVYRFLKMAAGPPKIEWNFATYYVIGPDSSIRSFSDIEPEDLEDVVQELINLKDEL